MGCDDSDGPGHAPRYLYVSAIMKLSTVKYTLIGLSILFLLVLADYMVIRSMGLIKHFRYLYESPKRDLEIKYNRILLDPKIELDISYKAAQNVVMFDDGIDILKNYRVYEHELTALYITPTRRSHSFLSVFVKINKTLSGLRVFSVFEYLETTWLNNSEGTGTIYKL